ncbi:MAG: citrate/2-methylcitrate synthase [Actinomycetota bacterium]
MSDGGVPIDQGLLSTRDAAARLGVKPATLYAYVSRGLLHRTVAMDGRSSLFDPAELDALRRGRRDRTEGELRTVIATAITRVDDQGLLVRGIPLVDLVQSGMGFVEVVEHLWDAPDGESWPSTRELLVEDLGESWGTDLDGLDALRVIVALTSATDPLRHDLSPGGVRAAGRRMITTMVHGLAGAPASSRGRARPLPDVLWSHLTRRRSTVDQRRVLDVALALMVDHGMAASTFAARIAASVRADPYSVVSAGLGALGGPMHGAASAGVHRLIEDVERTGDAAKAIGAVLRAGERVPGFGHSVYRVQDPRYTALMAAVIEAWRDDPRLQHIFRVRDVVSERRELLPNIDLAVGALTWLAGMTPDAGETIFAVARTAGWLAHAIEEYDEAPLRFRPRARYTGTIEPSNGDSGRRGPG